MPTTRQAPPFSSHSSMAFYFQRSKRLTVKTSNACFPLDISWIYFLPKRTNPKRHFPVTNCRTNISWISLSLLFPIFHDIFHFTLFFSFFTTVFCFSWFFRFTRFFFHFLMTFWVFYDFFFVFHDFLFIFSWVRFGFFEIFERKDIREISIR